MGCVVQAEETGSNIHKMAAHWPCWCVYWQTCGVHVTQPPQNGCPKWEAETFTSQRLLHTTETCSKFSTIQMQFENVECVEHTMDHPLQSMEEECPSHWQALEVCLIDPTSAAGRSVPSDNYCGADQGSSPFDDWPQRSAQSGSMAVDSGSGCACLLRTQQAEQWGDKIR